jgi:Tfp pilus assembly protein PilF
MGRRINSAAHAHGIAIAAFALALLLGAISLAPYLDAPFIFDDIHTIRDNHHLRDHLSPLYFFGHPESVSRMPSTLIRPLLTWTYALDFHRAGADPAAFRATNLCLHIINALLLFALTRKTKSLARMAPAAAVLFLLHPMASIQIGYVSNRSTLLSAFFYLVALLVYAAALSAEEDRGLVAVSRTASAVLLAFLYAGGLFSKASASTLPAAVLLWYLAFGRRSAKDRGSRGGIYLTVACLAALVLVFFSYMGYRAAHSAPAFFPPARPHPVWQYAAVQVRGFWTYARLLFWPINLSLEHEAWSPAGRSGLLSAGLLFSAAGLVFLIGVCVKYLRRAPEVCFAVIFSVIYLLPTSSVVPLTVLINENRAYLSALMVLWPALIGLEAARKRRPMLSLVLALLFVLLFAGLLGHRSRDYSSEVSIWRDAVRKAPGLARPHVNLGTSYMTYGRNGEARKSLAWAVRIEPCSSSALTNMGNIAYRRGEWRVAEQYYRRAIACTPASVNAMLNLSDILMERGQGEEGAGLLERALAHFPANSETLGRLGIWYIGEGGDRKLGLGYLRAAAECSASRSETSEWFGLYERYAKGED